MYREQHVNVMDKKIRVIHIKILKVDISKAQIYSCTVLLSENHQLNHKLSPISLKMNGNIVCLIKHTLIDSSS